MSRTHQIEQKTRRAVDDLEEYSRLIERLARRVSRIARKDELDADDYEAILPLDPALERFDAAVSRLKHAMPVGEAAPPAESTHHDSRIDGGIPLELDQVVSSSEAVIPDVNTEMTAPCVLRGRSPGIPIPTVLEFLASLRKSGTLTVRTANETFSIEVRDGHIIHAASDTTRFEERLGHILLKRGSIAAEQLQRVLDENQGGAAPLGEILVTEELVSREEVRAALHQQVSLLFRRLFTRTEKEFSFAEGAAAQFAIHIEANVTSMLLEGARSNDEASLQPSNDWQDWLK